MNLLLIHIHSMNNGLKYEGGILVNSELNLRVRINVTRYITFNADIYFIKKNSNV